MSFTYHKRTFLTPATSGHHSYIVEEVESSQEGEYQLGTNVLIIADCHRQIRLEFFFGNAQSRKQSLAKIDLLLEVLTAFRSALNEEAQLIAKNKS